MLEVGFCGFCVCSASCFFLLCPWASAFSRPSAQPRPGLLLGPPSMDVTSCPSVSGSPLAREYWSRSPTAGWSRGAQPGSALGAAAASSCYPRPGRLPLQCRGECGRPRAERPLGLPRVEGAPDSAGLGGWGAGSPRGRPGGLAGSHFRRLGVPACPLDPYSPKDCLADI